MNKSRKQSETNGAMRRWSILAVGFSTLILLVLWSFSGRVPQLQASENATKTIDALFTAMNAHDAERIQQCISKLDGFVQAGELAPAAGLELNRLCQSALNGNYKSAAMRLYDIIQKQ